MPKKELSKINKERLKAASTIAWIDLEGIVNEEGRPIDWHNFFFLIDLYKDRSKKIVIKKSAQSGVSTWAIYRTIHDAIFYGYNNIHVFPSDSDITKFVPSKVNQIIELNPGIKKYQMRTDKNEVGQKQFGKGFIFYKGSNSSTAAHMLTSDRNIYDEYDRADQKNLKDYSSRLEGAYSKKEEWWISTPTVPGFAIDKQWARSDQKHLRFDCPHCKKRLHLEWPRNVDFDKKEYICHYCGGVIDNTQFPNKIEEWNISWDPRYLNREISGYWINQMIVPWKPAKDLIAEYEIKKEEGDLEYFYNFNLGMPYMDGGSDMSAGLVLRNIVNRELVENDTIAGVDVQKGENFVTIGKVVDGEIIVIGLARIKDTTEKTKWERLQELIGIYDIRYMVIDATYTPNEVLDFAKANEGIVYAAWYQPDRMKTKIYRFGDKRAFTEKLPPIEERVRVLIDRERSIDRMVQFLKDGKIRFNFKPTDKELETLIRHMGTMYTREVQGKDGKVRREWANTGKNDYVHSTNYMLAAYHKKLEVEYGQS